MNSNSKWSLVTLTILIACLDYIDRPKMDEMKYVVSVEWYDEFADLNRQYTLFYYPSDRSVEMFDIKQRRTFLKRSQCDSVSEVDLYIGNTVRVFSRNLKILKYLDKETEIALRDKTERTYAMLKPEVIKQMGKIISVIEESGFRINQMLLTKIVPKAVAEFYREHQGKPFFDPLVEYISSGPVLAMELLAPSAVTNWRKTLGPTDPSRAREESPNSIRSLFGTDKTFNAAHGSDSIDSATRELNLIFSTQKSYLKDSDRYTLCLVKPHIINDGKLGNLIAHIQEHGFQILGLKMNQMTVADAEHFFQAYKGVWDDYPAHIKQFSSGNSVAIAVESDVRTFREFVGPFNPEIARKLRPQSLRGRFGRDLSHNAVHCTDLDTDGPLEVQFFFGDLKMTSI